LAKKKPRRSSSRSSSSSAKSKRRTVPSKKTRSSISRLSAERKLDIFAVGLTLTGLLLLIGLITGQESGFTAYVITLLYQIAGLGAFLLPVVLLIIGVWLLLRNEQRLPVISNARLLGLVLLFFNTLTWMHWFSGGGWQQAQAGGGGGYLGAVFEQILIISLGWWGGLVVLLAWLLIAAALTFDLSVPDLFRKVNRTVSKTGKTLADKSAIIREKAKRKQVDRQQQAGLEGFTPIFKRKKGEVARTGLESTKAGAKKPTQLKAAQKTQTQPVIRTGVRTGTAKPPWKLPDMDSILNQVAPAKKDLKVDEERARIIEETLASFGAPAHVVEIHRGPTVTQFGVEPDFVQTRTGRTRVRVGKISSLADDLTLALAASRIRIQAPVPGRRYVGIEVPNLKLSLVTLREGMQSKAFRRIRSPLRFVLGKDVTGKPLAVDLTAMPHLLIAGTTGSGKSVCINAILCCLLMQRTPAELRLVLVDPKRVELSGYNGIPHLLTPIIVKPEKVISVLKWMSREMDNRYHKFAELGARNIQEYNKGQLDKLPHILVVIDELADLMMLAPEETEKNLNRLAQLARATGIHLVIATQRPSVDVITGMIKANFPARVSFAVVAGVDSRVVLDRPGAERLIGRGDMLFQAPDSAVPKRLQGVFVSEEEIQRLVKFWQSQAEAVEKTQPTSVKRKTETIPTSTATLTEVPLLDEAPPLDEDPLLPRAIEIVRGEQRASISMLQRKLRIGYTRAARMVDRLEELEIIGKPANNRGVRPVLDYGDKKS